MGEKERERFFLIAAPLQRLFDVHVGRNILEVAITCICICLQLPVFLFQPFHGLPESPIPVSGGSGDV